MPQQQEKQSHIEISIGDTEIKLRLVGKGSFMMGDDKNGYDDEKPEHEVNIKHDFHLGQYQVTQTLYEEVMKKNPSYHKGKNRPVERVSWDEAKAFCKKLNDLGLAEDFKKKNPVFEKYEFCLPSESEWEYAAKGGQQDKPYDYFKYSGSDDLKQVGWYGGNSNMETKPVGLLLPNALGIYDMSGNVMEWCEDEWHKDYKDAPNDGTAWIDKSSSAADRVIRGGLSWDDAFYCRSANRNRSGAGYRDSYLGFRLAFSPVPKP